MADLAHGVQHEFWRPPTQAAAALETLAEQDLVEACDRCGTEFILGAKFCHNCGSGRTETSDSVGLLETGIAPLRELAERIGLPTPSLVAFGAGVGCLTGAVSVGLIYTAQTTLDWQAIQLWRVEWLLGAIAAFVAGMLLKKTSR